VSQTRYQPNERRGRRRLRYNSPEIDGSSKLSFLALDDDDDMQDDHYFIIRQQPSDAVFRTTRPSTSSFFTASPSLFGVGVHPGAQFKFGEDQQEECVNRHLKHHDHADLAAQQADDGAARALAWQLGRLALQTEVDTAREGKDEDDDEGWDIVAPRVLDFGPRLQPLAELDPPATVSHAQEIAEVSFIISEMLRSR